MAGAVHWSPIPGDGPDEPGRYRELSDGAVIGLMTSLKSVIDKSEVAIRARVAAAYPGAGTETGLYLYVAIVTAGMSVGGEHQLTEEEMASLLVTLGAE